MGQSSERIVLVAASRGGRPLAVALVAAVAVAGSIACSGSRIDSLDRQSGAPGEEFTIYGTNLDNFSPPPTVAPRLNRCGDLTLEVVQWFDDSIRVHIPRNVAAGVYGVSAFGQPLGAFASIFAAGPILPQRTLTPSLACRGTPTTAAATSICTTRRSSITNSAMS